MNSVARLAPLAGQPDEWCDCIECVPLRGFRFLCNQFLACIRLFFKSEHFSGQPVSQIRVCDDDDDDGDFIQPEISNKKAVCSEGLERSRF